MDIFGPDWSKALCIGCVKLSKLGPPVLPEWILTIIALEAAGTWDVNVLQGKAHLVVSSGPNDRRPEVSGSGGLRLSHGTGARGLFQEMPSRMKRSFGLVDVLSLYSVTDPIRQLNDGINRFYSQSVMSKFEGYKSRSALYCANLAPARLLNGTYDEDTIIYSANIEDKKLPNHTYWPDAFNQNAGAFGIKIDPVENPDQRLRMRDLAVGLDRAVAACQKRFDAEVEAAYVANVRG